MFESSPVSNLQILSASQISFQIQFLTLSIHIITLQDFLPYPLTVHSLSTIQPLPLLLTPLSHLFPTLPASIFNQIPFPPRYYIYKLYDVVSLYNKMDKIQIDHQEQLAKCHKQLVDSFAMFAAGEYKAPFQHTVHKLILMEEEHQKKKKKWKTFSYLQKQLLKKKSKLDKVSLFDTYAPSSSYYKSAAPPEEIQKFYFNQSSEDQEEWADVDEEITLVIDPPVKYESAAPGP